MNTQTKQSHNGVNIEAVGQLLNAIEQNRSHAKAGFTVTTNWCGGIRSTSQVNSWKLGGQTIAKNHTIHADEPLELGGSDTAPNPQEILLTAFNACIMATYVAICTMKGIDVQSLEIKSEGELDLHGFLGLDNTTDPGYHDLYYHVKFVANANEQTKREIHEAVKKQSPNFFNMARSIHLHDSLTFA